MSTPYPSDLSDAEWGHLQYYLLPLPRRGRPRMHPLRRILDATFYACAPAALGAIFPTNFPLWQTVFSHLRCFRLFSIQQRRWVVERCFALLIRNRWIAKDCERKVQASETLIKVAMIRLLVTRLGHER